MGGFFTDSLFDWQAIVWARDLQLPRTLAKLRGTPNDPAWAVLLPATGGAVIHPVILAAYAYFYKCCR